MDTPHVYNLEDLVGLSDADILKVLDDSWPWPLDAVQNWFESLWNSILSWIDDAKQWIVDHVAPVINTVWDWIESAKQWIVDHVVAAAGDVWGWMKSVGDTIWSNLQGIWAWIAKVFQDGVNFIIDHIGPFFDWLWKWLQDAFANLWNSINGFLQDIWNGLQDLGQAVRDKVDSINAWFSNEFIDPFIDWLLKFPGNFVSALEGLITGLGTRLEAWFTHESPGLPGVLKKILMTIAGWIGNFQDWCTAAIAKMVMTFDPQWDKRPFFIQWLELFGEGLLALLGGWLISALGPAIWGFLGWIGRAILTAGPTIGAWALKLLGPIGKWFLSNIVGLLGSGAILTLEVTGQLEKIIDKYVTPAITSVFDNFEAMGPVSPASGKSMSTGITKLATFTISGLAGMTLAGEMLSPLKHIGMGHVAAIVYDLINYKTLTAAFMGVLAAVYIKTPLTYYYNRVARPSIPDERGLADMGAEQLITREEYLDWMAYHGYTDDWSSKIYETINRPMTPYMLRSLAEAGLLDMDFLEDQLKSAGYSPRAIPFIKQMMANLAGASLATVSTSTAMTRFQEGLDDEQALRQNLSALGVSSDMLDRYVFAAQLKYLYDYQVDIKTFYIDEYHRRDIEEDELRQDLVATGLNADRIELIVQAQKIKRLKAAAPAAPPELKIQEETIRTRRTKNLISADQEVTQLVSLGLEMPYALAIADQDTVKMMTAVPSAVPPPPPPYETEAGKTEVDTIRRLARSSQITDVDEFNSLLSLGMSQELAKAIVDNDLVRMKKEAGA